MQLFIAIPVFPRLQITYDLGGGACRMPQRYNSSIPTRLSVFVPNEQTSLTPWPGAWRWGDLCAC